VTTAFSKSALEDKELILSAAKGVVMIGVEVGAANCPFLDELLE
jgi:hypothetical protein